MNISRKKISKRNPWRLFLFSAENPSTRQLLRGSSAVNQGEDTLQCSAIADTLHGIHPNKKTFRPTKKIGISVLKILSFWTKQLHHFGQMNHAIKMPVSLHCAALSQSFCRCPCCTFWHFCDKNHILATTPALVAEHICIFLQFPPYPGSNPALYSWAAVHKNSLWWPAWAHGYSSCPCPYCQGNSVRPNKPMWGEYLLPG